MIKRKELTYDNSYLLKVFNRDFPHLVTMAEESQNIKLFRGGSALIRFFPD